MSCANNHTLDAAHAGLADTLAALRRQGIATAGAGDSLAQARKPAVVEQA
jgi:poly-gamma-glutamate capsule biosynthesis protein CapA/YwtB (metallophosphatase superfamily)